MTIGEQAKRVFASRGQGKEEKVMGEEGAPDGVSLQANKARQRRERAFSRGEGSGDCAGWSAGRVWDRAEEVRAGTIRAGDEIYELCRMFKLGGVWAGDVLWRSSGRGVADARGGGEI